MDLLNCRNISLSYGSLIKITQRLCVPSKWALVMLLGDVSIVRKIPHVLFVNLALKKEIIPVIGFSLKEMSEAVVTVVTQKHGMRTIFVQIIEELIILIQKPYSNRFLQPSKIQQFLFSEKWHKI